MAGRTLKPLPSASALPRYTHYTNAPLLKEIKTFRHCATKMAVAEADSKTKIIDSHLHVWAPPKEAADKYRYFPGQEPTLPGEADFLLQCMEEAGVDGTLIVQPINHMFDHSYVTRHGLEIISKPKIFSFPLDSNFEKLKNEVVVGLSIVLKKHPTKFVGCCLANPVEDGSGVKQLEHLILKDGYRAVRFNPNLWPSGQKMTNEAGKALFSRAGELKIPVGFLCMKGLDLYISEIEELCTEFPSTIVLIDHLGFCKPPTNENETLAFSNLLKLSRFPQVYVKFSGLFRLSRTSFPYQDLTPFLSQVVSNFGANHVMWGSDFPFVVPECSYKGAKEAVSHIASLVPLSSSEMEWVMGRTVMQLFEGQWLP